MIYRILITKNAEKQLSKIEKSSQDSANNITILIDLMKITPNPHLHFNCKKLKAYIRANCYRWRVGDYRIIGQVLKDEIVIQIFEIAHRQGAYKGNK